MIYSDVNSYTCRSVLALLREPQHRSPSARPQLEIYSASGGSLASFPVNPHVTNGLVQSESVFLLLQEQA